MATMQVSMSDDLKAYIDAHLAKSDGVDASDYIAALVREDERKLEWVRAEVAKGEASGISSLNIDEAIEQAFADIDRKCA